MTQEKKKLHKKALSVATYYHGKVQPYSDSTLAASKQKLLEMAQRDKERMMLEESRNNVEAYIYKIKNKLEDDAEMIGKVTTQEQRDLVRKLAEDVQEWMEEEGYSADYPTMVDKFAELSTPFEKILLRVKESNDRPEAIVALKKKLDEIEQLILKWEESMPHITAEEKEPVSVAINDIRKWLADKEDAQSKKQPHEDAAFLSSEVPVQIKPVEALVVKLGRKPKPKPVKNETATNATEDTAADTESSTKDESKDASDAKDPSGDDLKSESEKSDDADSTATPDAEEGEEL